MENNSLKEHFKVLALTGMSISDIQLAASTACAGQATDANPDCLLAHRCLWYISRAIPSGIIPCLRVLGSVYHFNWPKGDNNAMAGNVIGAYDSSHGASHVSAFAYTPAHPLGLAHFRHVNLQVGFRCLASC